MTAPLVHRRRAAIQTDTGVDICLLSAGLPSSNPRLVKEAAALVDAGYLVHCIVGDYDTPLREHDASLLNAAGATFTRVGLGGWRYRPCRLRQKLAMTALQRGWMSDSLAAWSISTQSGALQRAARQVPARLYLGHTLPALPAAVLAAERTGALAGFDAEDFHSGETGDPARDHISELVEQRFLPRCRHLTAASPQIAAAYQRRFGVRMTPILNVFPRSAFDAAANPPRPPYSSLSYYWFSQTIGPCRGLEQFLHGMAAASSRPRLALRGVISDDYRARLLALADALGLAGRITLLPSAPPDDMVPLAAEHDVGLSLEQSSPRNRDLCLTNKVFTYVAAGIPQLLSRTTAQTAIANDLGDAALLVNLDDPADIARTIDRLQDDTFRDRCRRAATLARERFCWEEEQRKLLGLIGEILRPLTATASTSRPLDQLAGAAT